MSSVDLSALRMAEQPAPIQKRPLGPRILAYIAGGLVMAVATTSLWALLRPMRVVPMAQVEAAASTGPSTVAMAEAAGWIEPDPFPILVRPLVGGRVEQIPMLEGTAVVEGETVLATLASATLRAQRERAEVVLAEREHEVAVVLERLKLAERQFAQRAQLRTALADAEAIAAAKEARSAAARGMHERTAAEERSAFAARDAQRLLEQAGGSYGVARQRAEAAAEAATANVAAAAKEAVFAEHELAAAQQALGVAKEVANDPVDLVGALAIAKAEAERARAQRDVARAELQIASREVDWLTVRSPFTGVVMKVLSQPGAAVGPEGEPILSLYDPKKLRARIDVPLASVGAIREGQRVELRSEVLGGQVVEGKVQRIQRESDLLKNTLQVKVQVIDPPALLRPETLCRARFLVEEAIEAVGAQAAFLVPKAAVQGGRVYVLDPTLGTARGIAVEVVQEDATSVVVRGELSVTQRAILVPVAEGERVREEPR